MSATELRACPDGLKELIVSLVAKHFDERARRELLFTRWKDGIDVEYPRFALEQFATGLIAAWNRRPAPADVAELRAELLRLHEEAVKRWGVYWEYPSLDPVNDSYRSAYEAADSAFRQALSALGAGGDGWRPIETAPNDELVLLWCEGTEYVERGCHVGRMAWMSTGRFPIVGATLYSTSARAFTHWQPLPAAPQGRQESKNG